jgi:hypothetical protein
MREAYGELCIRLGISEARCDVSNLDVNTRWNSTFLMIAACFKYESVFDALCNHRDFQAKLSPYALTLFDWRVLQSIKVFLEPPFQGTSVAGASRYSTLSMQPKKIPTKAISRIY